MLPHIRIEPTKQELWCCKDHEQQKLVLKNWDAKDRTPLPCSLPRATVSTRQFLKMSLKDTPPPPSRELYLKTTQVTANIHSTTIFFFLKTKLMLMSTPIAKSGAQNCTVSAFSGRRHQSNASQLPEESISISRATELFKTGLHLSSTFCIDARLPYTYTPTEGFVFCFSYWAFPTLLPMQASSKLYNTDTDSYLLKTSPSFNCVY